MLLFRLSLARAPRPGTVPRLAMAERPAMPSVSRARRLAVRAVRALTHPLLPDDDLGLIDPRWSARELTGTVVETRDETADARTVVVRPTRPWPGHRAGQYASASGSTAAATGARTR
jgi:hypothetical protein